MSSITNVNNNSSVVNVGRTTPVSPGPQTAEKSIPVVMSSDQTAIPVVEQNKVQSEVALSLLGIPRAEVALGIFADVNTYDVNPSEWSMSPAYHVSGYGVKHLPTEAGALVEAPRNKVSVLTSKRFFRYQPGRVSAATFGIRSSVGSTDFSQNPTIRKYGIYDKYDGYYWETRNSGKEDNFSVVRRTQSIAYSPVSPYGIGSTGAGTGTLLRGNTATGEVSTTQVDDYRIVGQGAGETEVSEGKLVSDRQIIADNRFEIIDNALLAAYNQYPAPGTDYDTTGAAGATITVDDDASTTFVAAGFATEAEHRYYLDLAAGINAENGGAPDITPIQVRDKCKRDLDYWIDNFLLDMKHDGKAHTIINTSNFALSDGASDWYDIKVGLFPKITRFEKPVHLALRQIFKEGKLYLADGSDTSVGTIGVPTGTSLGLSDDGREFLGDDTNGLLTTVTEVAFANDDFYDNGITAPSAISAADYGTKSKLDTFFDVKKNFWAYWVTIKTLAGTATYDTNTKVNYYLPAGGLSQANGDGSIITTEDIKYKCQRDVGYIIDGYKNDLIGGGDAETIYNASMFLRGTGLSVYSQQGGAGNNDGNISEPERHAHLKTRILNDLKAFGYADGSTEHDKIETLAELIVDNFDTEEVKGMEVGNRGFAGNLITLRDGLVHVHAGVYDPSMLKDSKKIVAKVTAGTNDGTDACRFKLTSGVVTFGQHIKISWTDTASVKDGINKGEILKVTRVYGPKGNEFTASKEDGTAVTFTQAESDSLTKIYIETVVPFIFPKDYDITSSNIQSFASKIDTTPATINNAAAAVDGTDARVFNTKASDFDTGLIPKGASFPYMYSKTDDLLSTTFYGINDYVGFVNTAIDPAVSLANVNTIRSQVDNVNFYPEYVNWIKNNVKPEYYGVYEYRIPRSRFTHDALDGIKSTDDAKTSAAPGSRNRVYSDVATGSSGIARPGENYVITDNVAEKQDSLYAFDFTKVTMLKIEFSWYGAVGALFLAYVPVGNGEARWVRVHHLRASNQLKIASLGNATLPITYTTYGGGDQYSLGDLGDVTENQIPQGYGNISHNIVKYGASYYIDGGDRGTVRLYSYNNDAQVPTVGKQFIQTSTKAGTAYLYTAEDTTITGSTMPSIVVNALDDAGAIISPEFYIGATVKTASRLDQNVKVVWTDATKVYLSGPLSGATTSATLLPDRAETIYGLETKKVILSTREGNAVRNRVQVYPTKLSTANTGNNTVRLRFKKTPIFQTLVATTGTIRPTAEYTIDNTNAPIAMTQSSTYMVNGTSVYGWFRGRIEADDVTVFGRLYKEADLYYFEMLQSFEGTVVLKNGVNDFFLKDLRFTADGDQVASVTDVTKSTSEIEGLSSLKIATDTTVPIPNTGSNVATIYLQQGTEQFDLSAYFDYNKEYLSFPLTNVADSLYFAVDSDTDSTTTDDNISLGVTWEEQ